MKKRRWAALVLCLLLVFRIAAPSADAADDVYFVAVRNEVLPLSDETMPFWSGGYLYIAASIFSGTVGKDLGVRCRNVESEQVVILYSDGSRYLMFKAGDGYTVDSDGNIFHPGAIQRGGTVYVPAYLVAKYFDLLYSVMDVENGQLVWIRQPSFSMTDKQFANAAEYPCAIRYSEYIKKKKDPEPSEPATPDTSGTEIDGKSVYLCVEAGDDTASLLDALDYYEAQAAFFCTPEFLEKQGSLLRRMTATGQSIGLLVDAADPARTVEEQLEAGNQALERATCGGTRLAMIRNGKEEDLQTARAAGYCCVEPSLDRSAYELKTTANAQNLLQKVSAFRGNVSVWLGDSASGAGLRVFLYAIEDADGRCLALTETS